MRLRVWTPSDPGENVPFLAALLPALARHAEVLPLTAPDADLELFPIADDPAFAVPYREALRRPGVILLADWDLHTLVEAETLGRGDVRGYLREMRRAGGERGTFVGRQVVRGLGGELLPRLFPLNDRLLEESLAVVAMTEHIRARAARVLPGRPVLKLPLHLLTRGGGPSRVEARQARGLGGSELLVWAAGDALSLDRVRRVAARLKRGFPSLLLETPTRGQELSSLPAADVVLVLGAPSGGGVPRAVVRAMEAGIPTLVSVGSSPARELPEGAVVGVDPGPSEEDEIEALLSLLLGDPTLREQVGARAREHLARQHPEALAEELARFLAGVAEGREAVLAARATDRAPEGSRLDYLIEEVRRAARDVGLLGARLALRPLLGPLGKDPS